MEDGNLGGLKGSGNSVQAVLYERRIKEKEKVYLKHNDIILPFPFFAPTPPMLSPSNHYVVPRSFHLKFIASFSYVCVFLCVYVYCVCAICCHMCMSVFLCVNLKKRVLPNTAF